MRRVPVLLAVALLPAVAGCEPDAFTPVPGRALELEATDYRIRPQRVRVAPGRITVTVRNRSAGPHNLVIDRNGRERLRILTLLPGDTRTTTVRLARGTYRMRCTHPHHVVLGEHGTLRVG